MGITTWGKIVRETARIKDDAVSFVKHALGWGGTIAQDCLYRFDQAGIQMCDSNGAVVKNLEEDFGVPGINPLSIFGNNARVVFREACKNQFAEQGIVECNPHLTCKSSIEAYKEAGINQIGQVKGATMAYNAAVLCCPESEIINCQLNYKQCTTLTDKEVCEAAYNECGTAAVGCTNEEL